MGDLHTEKASHISVPITKGAEIHLNKKDVKQKSKVGDDVNVILPMKTTSDEGDAIRYKQKEKPQVFQRHGITLSEHKK